MQHEKLEHVSPVYHLNNAFIYVTPRLIPGDWQQSIHSLSTGREGRGSGEMGRGGDGKAWGYYYKSLVREGSAVYQYEIFIPPV